MNIYQCLVCGYDQMPNPPAQYNICPCCGVEYELDDVFESHLELRNEWLRNGGAWFSRAVNQQPGFNWNPWDQLDLAGFDYDIERPPTNATTNYISASIYPRYSGALNGLMAMNA